MVNKDMSKVAPNESPASDLPRRHFPVIGGRIHPDDLQVISMAAVIVRKPRGVFLVEAALDKARSVVAAHEAAQVA